MSTNDKALHILFCSLGPDIYSKMSSCTSAKEVWDSLETTYEGTNDVKETKIGLLNLNYENFKMEPNEDITKMFDRFSVIVNGLKVLVRSYRMRSSYGSLSTLFPSLGIARERL